ncbi:MAG TPA: FAD-dependent oxidoreductase [Gemmatimonadaceae bacterium]|nr:FAD-dependent oxidoreductase [Gemmatimonadaceae bacterium]
MNAADAVVVGGGVIGSAIAYYLSRRGFAVTLVDRDDLASGTSGACGGSITMQTKQVGPVLSCALQSQKLYRGLSDELAMDLEYREHGSLIVAETDAELEYLRMLFDAQQATGLRIQWLDGTEARAWGPGLGSSVRAGTFCSTDAEVNPLRVVFALSEAARRNGAVIKAHTAVTGIRVENGRVVGVRTNRGDIATPLVVNAAGVWVPLIGQLVGMTIPVGPRRGVVLVTDNVPIRVLGTLFSTKYLISKRHPEGHARGLDTRTRWTGGLVLSQTVAGNLLIGSSRETSNYQADVSLEVIEFIAREALRLVPVARVAQLIRAYAGLRPFTSDGLPIIGEAPSPAGFIVAAGHEGDGVALAPWTGSVVAELIASGEPPDDLRPFGLGRL